MVDDIEHAVAPTQAPERVGEQGTQLPWFDGGFAGDAGAAGKACDKQRQTCDRSGHGHRDRVTKWRSLQPSIERAPLRGCGGGLQRLIRARLTRIERIRSAAQRVARMQRSGASRQTPRVPALRACIRATTCRSGTKPR
jgi:hypothetical protein